MSLVIVQVYAGDDVPDDDVMSGAPLWVAWVGTWVFLVSVTARLVGEAVRLAFPESW